MSGWTSLSDWYDAVGPEGAAIAIVRVVIVALAAWLLLATLLQVLAAVPSLRPLRPLADLISPRSMQRLGRSLAGLSLTAGLAAPAPSAGTLAPREDRPPASAPAPDEDPPTATMRVIEPTPAPPEPAPAPTAASGSTVVVARGDSFWSIAVEAVTDATGRRPSASEVARYWDRLVEANRSRLVVPDNPDLLYAGQSLDLPPVT